LEKWGNIIWPPKSPKGGLGLSFAWEEMMDKVDRLDRLEKLDTGCWILDRLDAR
jgi:hypothetical protein